MSPSLTALVVLVVLKTAADWRAHVAERRKFGGPLAATVQTDEASVV